MAETPMPTPSESNDRAPRNDYGSLRQNMPGNTKKAKDKEPEKKIEPITSGKVVEKKTSLGRRVRESFTGDDSRTVGNYLLFDVAIPAFKQLISEGVSTAVERLLFGGESRGGARRGYGGGTYTTYGSRYTNSGSPTQMAKTQSSVVPSYTPNNRAVHNFQDIVMDNRGAAEEVIDLLSELIQTYGHATLSDFYELVNITPDYPDEKWGWTSMAGANVRRVHNGYLINLPRTEPLTN